MVWWLWADLVNVIAFVFLSLKCRQGEKGIWERLLILSALIAIVLGAYLAVILYENVSHKILIVE